MRWSETAAGAVAIAAALGLKALIFVGLLGALVSLRFAPPRTWGQGVWTTLGGALCANYAAPLIVGWLEVKSVGGEASIAFLIGLFGMQMAAEAMKLIQDGSLLQFIKSRFSGGNA